MQVRIGLGQFRRNKSQSPVCNKQTRSKIDSRVVSVVAVVVVIEV